MGIRKWKEEEILEIIKLYKENGLTLESIGTKFGSKRQTISKLLQNNNIEIRRRGTTINKFLNESYFENIDSEIKAYLLGFILTDGSVYWRNDRKNPTGILSLEVQEKDLEIIKLLLLELNCNSKISYRIKNKKITTGIKISSSKIVNSLEKYNIVPNKTYKLESINQSLIPKELYLHYLRGLLDGDGSIYKTISIYNKTHFHIAFSGYSKDFILSFQKEINLLINEKNFTKLYKGTCWRTQWNKKQNVIDIVNFLYRNSQYYLTRKYLLAMEILGE